MSSWTQLLLQSTKVSAPAPGMWAVDSRAALHMGQDLRLCSRFGFQTVTVVRYQNRGVKLDYRALNYETIRVFCMSRCTVRQSDPPFASPIHPPICHLLIYSPYALCTHDSPPARQCTSPTSCTLFPQPPTAVPSHRTVHTPLHILLQHELNYSLLIRGNQRRKQVTANRADSVRYEGQRRPCVTT